MHTKLKVQNNGVINFGCINLVNPFSTHLQDQVFYIQNILTLNSFCGRRCWLFLSYFILHIIKTCMYIVQLLLFTRRGKKDNCLDCMKLKFLFVSTLPHLYCIHNIHTLVYTIYIYIIYYIYIQTNTYSFYKVHLNI